MVVKNKKAVYEKHHSFDNFYSKQSSDICVIQKRRAVRILESCVCENKYRGEILAKVLSELKENEKKFKITSFIAEEMALIEDAELLEYLFHRYRYDVFPQEKTTDKYPPCIQIEPVSFCNYKCSFCFQNNEYFSSAEGKGVMPLALFKDIVDQIDGNVKIVNMASRGEPLICKEIDKMLEYCSGKFLSLKLNTNASLLDEKKSHAILSGGVNTIAFSIDSADKSGYEKLRKGGNFEKVFGNIRKFHEIHERHYPDKKIIVRISGVKVDDSQKMADMVKVWGEFVDQISFVKYNPWENVYESEKNNHVNPCSDLWRRCFVWHNGVVNPCDTEFKSSLAVGNVKEDALSNIWTGEKYEYLRRSHLCGHRAQLDACSRCIVN